MLKSLPFSLIFILLIGVRVQINSQPTDCQFLNPVYDVLAEAAVVNYYYQSEPFVFHETDFFQPQCILCMKTSGQVCFGYKGGESYGIASGNVEKVIIVANLPYVYSIGENVGNISTTVLAVALLREEDLSISYRTLQKFKGIGSGNPLLSNKQVVLRLCIKCLINDTTEHTVTVKGAIYGLTVRLSVNVVESGVSTDLTGYKQARIDCATKRVVNVSTINNNIPLDEPCTIGSCLGKYHAYCSVYLPTIISNLLVADTNLIPISDVTDTAFLN